MSIDLTQKISVILAGLDARMTAAEGGAKPPIVFSFIGSSSPAEYLSTYTGGTPSANVQASDGGTNFGTLSQGRMGIEAGTTIFNTTGRQVHYIRSGASGTTLAGWESNASNLLTNAIASINNAVATGRTMTGVLLQVGFNDVDFGNINGSSAATQAGLLRSMISKIRAGTNLPNLTFFIGTTQDEPDNPAGLRFQREAEMLVANNDANVRFGFSTYDLLTRDNTHQTEPSQIVTASRFAAQVIALINGTAQKRAAYFTTAAAVSDTQTDVSLVHVSGTDFSPSTGISGFRVFNNAGTELAVSAAVRQSATVVRVTHASKAGGIGSVIYLPNAQASDDSTVLHDNSALALPFDVTSAAIAIPAAAGAADTTPPTITSASTFSQPENSAFSTTLTANESVTWSKAGGADTARFTLSGATLSLPAQDFEAPADADANNSYLVTVRATDSAGNTTDQGIAVTITDVAEGSPAGKTAQMNMVSTDGETAVPGWNTRFFSQPNAVITMLASDGSATGWTETFTNSVRDGASNNAGASTGNNSGVFPDNVLRSNFFTGSAADLAFTNTVAGLDPTKTYKLVASGSRSPAPSPARIARFTVSGLSSQTIAPQTVNVALNTSLAATFTGIKPTADGKITLTTRVDSGDYVHYCGYTIQQETA